MKLALTATALSLAALTACTPPQLASIESHLGLDFTDRQERDYLALPDAPITIGVKVFNTDGSVTTLSAPAGSRCPQYFDEALNAGWSSADWPRLDAIIYRESMCDPGVYNGVYRDSSYGLLQLNMKAHASWVGPLLNWDFSRLYDPYTNLLFGRALYYRALAAYGCGWQPWSYSC